MMNFKLHVFFTTLFLSLFSLLQVGALPVQDMTKRDVFVPKVVYPRAGVVWSVGQRHNVTWDTSNAPTHISNGASVILRKGELATPLILAKGFDLRSGRVEVTVPWVVPGDDYTLVLFGDSGNFSPTFSIKGSL
jgi:hypothetical protein